MIYEYIFGCDSGNRRPGQNQQFALSIGRGPYANVWSTAFRSLLFRITENRNCFYLSPPYAFGNLGQLN